MRRSVLSLLAATAALSLGFAAPTRAAEDAVVIPAPAMDAAPASGIQTAVIAGGCFWGMEAVFQSVKGVHSVTSGYAGGTAGTATYAQVSTEKTGHAEAVRIAYDPRKVSYGTLLRIYFSVAHDPTQLNRQGPDRGPSYRSAIFPQDEEQRRVAAAYIEQLTRAKAFSRPIVTRLETGNFYPAEAYHQRYFEHHPGQGYCAVVIGPKVDKFRKTFADLLKVPSAG